MEEKNVRKALQKCAVGFVTGEVVEEFEMRDGELTLVKKKVTRRSVPPDIKAVKMFLESDPLADLSDEQLKEEKERLIKMLKEDDFD